MPKKSKILYDTTEIVFLDYSGKKPVSRNLTYDKINKIQFEASSVKKLFRSVPSEKLSIYLRGVVEPLVLFEADEKDYWAEYKRDLSRFAKQHRITYVEG